MSSRPKPGGMAAMLRTTMADESAAKAPVLDSIAERMRRADGLSPRTTPPASTAEAPAAARKRKAPKRIRTNTKRDSFNLPAADHALIHATIERALALGTWTTKSSVVRAGLHVLAKLADDDLRAALMQAHPLPPGRKPKPSADE